MQKYIAFLIVLLSKLMSINKILSFTVQSYQKISISFYLCRMNMSKMRNSILWCLLAATFLAGCKGKANSEGEQPAVDTIPVLVTRVANCSRLYTSEYQLRKILIYDDPAVLSGKLFNHDIHVDLPLGKRRIAIPVTATAKAYINLSKIGPKDIHRDGDKLEIVLPDPEVTLTATQIDHKGVKQRVALLRKNFSDEEITRIQQQGRRDMIKSLSKTQIIDDARASAARQLVPIAVQLGFKEENVTVTFRKDLTANDIPGLIRYLN
jgi:hypothetical protein